MNRLLTLDHVSFAYDRRVVVEDLSLTLDQGDYLAIIGENGSGKTTLLLGLLGLKEPSNGVIHRSEALKSHRIGYLPQQMPAQRDFPATVEEIVLSGRLNRHGFVSFYGREDKQAADISMRRLSVDDLRKRSFRDLSGGQRQRVLLARALTAAEGLLLLDEPVAGLDPIVSHDFYRLVRELNRDGVTVIMVSHDVHCVTRDATHVLHLGYRTFYFGEALDYLDSAVAGSYLPPEGDLASREGCGHIPLIGGDDDEKGGVR
ncbi:MAG TPA: metal ABC transporter ATP-binding protein [Clostridia bacterium]|nr:metal ABC transporter ATP-binding protein [Clostridia bacterium]